MPVEVGLPRKDNSQGPRKNSASLTIFEGIYQAQIDEVKMRVFVLIKNPTLIDRDTVCTIIKFKTELDY